MERCRIKDLDVRYITKGEGKPVLLLHGYSTDHTLMTGCLEPLLEGRGYKRIYVDLPGMGKTESREWIQNADDLLSVVRSFITQVIGEEEFILIGESYGAYLSRGLVCQIPEQIKAFCLLCPIVVSNMKERKLEPFRALEVDPEFVAGIDDPNKKVFQNMMTIQNEYTWKRFKSEVLSGIEVANNDFLRNIKRNSYSLSFDPDQPAKPFEKPTLFLVGKQDALAGYEDAFNIVKNYSSSSFVAVEKSGHYMQIEQPEIFEFHVKNWLASL